MSEAFYNRMAATAVRLITKFGTTVTLPRETGGSGPDPVTGETTEGTDDTKTTIGLLKPYPDNLVDGTRIQSTDKMLILTGTVEPLHTDTPQMNGVTLGNVQSIKSVNPTGTALVYFVQIRK